MLQVRKDEPEISMEIINEVMDKRNLGLAASRLPESPAKQQLARIVAARAVVVALTPGMPPLQRLTILPRGDAIARTLFLPQVSQKWTRQEDVQGRFVIFNSSCVSFQRGESLLVLYYFLRPSPNFARYLKQDLLLQCCQTCSADHLVCIQS